MIHWSEKFQKQKKKINQWEEWNEEDKAVKVAVWRPSAGKQGCTAGEMPKEVEALYDKNNYQHKA